MLWKRFTPMKTPQIATAILAFAAGAGFMAEYHKAQKPAPIIAVQPSPVPAKRTPSAQERLAEIERLLSLPLTGVPEDTDWRSALRSERDVLTGRSKASTRNKGPVIETVPPSSQQPKTAVAVAQ